ncbi:MAG TPA: ABC transporter permease [Candidatus Limnocylindria bacterium]|nr:ABC transporter permease [Candidatus Limnocylindria bacterium]
MNDLKFAFRQLLKNPGFTAVAVLTLALGIGANATIFSIINSILVKPLRVSRPEEIAGVYQHERDNPDSYHLFSYPDFVDLRSAPDSAFAELFAFGRASVAIRDELTKEVPANLVSANYFAALGVPPTLGRVFAAEEETSGAQVAVLSHAFWLKLGGDPAIVGTTLKLTRGDVTVIGVMPRGFTGAQQLAPALYLPLGAPESLMSVAGQAASRPLANRADHRFMIMGRLRPGLTLAKAAGALAVMSQRLAIPDPADPKARTLIATPPARFNFSDGPVRNNRGLGQIAGFAFGLSALVLLIACLNLANMMLARGTARRKEVAVRLALGAGRRRILTQLLTEGLLLALLGGAAGLCVSMGATRILSALIYSGAGMPADFPIFDFAPDGRALGALLVFSGWATVFFALGPAWSLARREFNADLKQHSGEDVRKGRFGVRDFLAVGQMAFTLALLVAAALFCRSAIKAYDANPGFELGSNFYVALAPQLTGESDARAWALNRAATERLAALPGVESVSSALYIPFGGSWDGRDVQLGGAPPPSDGSASLAGGRALPAAYNVVGANYFRTLGIPLQRGREFERREEATNGTQSVAIISQALADQFWPGADPLGRTIQFPGSTPQASPTRMTVVGVVPTVQRRLFKEEPPAAVYVPLGQEFHPDFKLHVRVAPGVDPGPLMATARAELRRLDAGIPLTEIKTLSAMHRDGPDVRVMRLGSVLFGAFGGLAMLLSSLGIYGLKAYSVARRTREIGIRMALGANPRHVVRLILRESVWLAGLGLGIGLLLALAVGKLAANFLYRVPATDPVTFVIVPPLLLAVALFACWLPARRAARVNPMVALRAE